MSGGGGKQETKTEPWGGLKPYLKTGYQQLQQNVLQNPMEFFPGQTYVDFSPETELALGGQTSRALGGNPLLGMGQQQVGETLGGEYLGQNPYLDQIGQNVMSTVRPSVDAMFEGAGRTGSPLHAEALGRGVSQAMSPFLFGSYEQERNRMMDASRLAAPLAREDYYDIGQLGQVGAAREAQEGLGLQEAMRRFEFAQQEPAMRTERFLQGLQGTAPLVGGMGTTSQGTPPVNPWALGGGVLTGLGSAAMPWMFIK